MKPNVLSSPFTTATGWTLIGLVVADVLSLLLDNNPATNPNWPVTVGFLMTGIAQLKTADHKAVEKVAQATNDNSARLGTEIIVKDKPQKLSNDK